MANLVSVAEYKESEGINSPKDDLRLNSLVPSVSQLVKLIVEIVLLTTILQIKQKF